MTTRPEAMASAPSPSNQMNNGINFVVCITYSLLYPLKGLDKLNLADYKSLLVPKVRHSCIKVDGIIDHLQLANSQHVSKANILLTQT